jgi:hypothetical protein
MSEHEQTIIRRLTEDESHLRLPIKELPVKDTCYLTETSYWTGNICVHILKQWEHAGFVLINNRQKLTDEIHEDFHLSSTLEAKGLINSAIKEGVFIEQDGWLIPGKTLLRCASSRKADPYPYGDTTWADCASTYENVKIFFLT